jgi:hypothetical protein
MLPSLAALDYLTLGQIVSTLRSPRNARADDYQVEISNLMDWLQTCDFPAAKAAAEGLKSAKIPHKEGVITESAARELAAMVGAILRTLEHEARGRQVAVLNTAGVSAKLRGLPGKVTLNDTQRHLLDETVRCVEVAAYRAAAVMGWNLAYDYVRRWMWDDAVRRAAFNAQLTAITNRSGAKVYTSPLTAYDDFFTVKPVLGERDVLDLMRDAGLLSGIYEKLAAHLKDRNSFAHANDLVPSMYQTNHYLEQLVDIITNAPFV